MGPTAGAESETPRNSGSLSRPVGAPTEPLFLRHTETSEDECLSECNATRETAQEKPTACSPQPGPLSMGADHLFPSPFHSVPGSLGSLTESARESMKPYRGRPALLPTPR